MRGAIISGYDMSAKDCLQIYPIIFIETFIYNIY